MSPYEQQIAEATAEAALVWRALIMPALNEGLAAMSSLPVPPARRVASIYLPAVDTWFLLFETTDQGD
jgi:hypothetical protein